MSKILNLLTGGGTSLIDKAVDIADKFIETPEEKKAFIEKAYEQEIEDRRAARDLGKSKVTPIPEFRNTPSIAFAIPVIAKVLE